MKLGFPCAAAIAALAFMVCPAAVSAGGFADPGSGFSNPSGDFAARLLASHNRERSRLGMPALRWSARLSVEAEQWAASLAQRRAFEHSQDRDDTGENLWMGSANWYSPEQMVGAFLAERSDFHPGRFPQVSTTGNWSDVGHYTQIIWPETRAVGCALAHTAEEDVLVCRYWPAGNVYGEHIG
jgi:uncharacterized protein YkwD